MKCMVYVDQLNFDVYFWREKLDATCVGIIFYSAIEGLRRGKQSGVSHIHNTYNIWFVPIQMSYYASIFDKK